ncbi:nucleoside diphosphate kinase, mitochondrial isoform X2 [Prinia subflava]|uniref:nucleoside diphosphate kinase, mitochondrial isoform X2 n=1 Tax=Prinia subflava TaxID=208062 RepID=UPI002FE30524
MGSLGRCLARSLPRGQPGLSTPGPRCYGSARAPAATVSVCGGLPCPAEVTVTRGPRAAPPALQEKTLVVAKPDALQRRLLGDIIQRFERRGFKLVAMKLLQVDRRLVDQHYEQLRLKPFYPALVTYMTSGPVVAMERGPCQRLRGDGPAGDRLLVPAGRAGGVGQQGQGQHLRALGSDPGRGHPRPQ